ncbi:MAG: hypothetical protein HRU76_10200 [Phycisphaeraceae bacterium]|nr:terpene cyclase/mutase family protein [Phycisphaerales bacterium]QOJ17931.1 MAG: hypothetical protein HRU76_10200 [Phycisphaeraceae bacterium]
MMNHGRLVPPLIGLLSLALGAATPAQDSGAPALRRTGDLLRPADKPLDPRIKPDRITESDPPALPDPGALASPPPPAHRLAASAAEVPLDAERWARAHEAIRRGLDFLRARQHASGGWMVDAQVAPTDEVRKSPVSVAVTAMALKAFAQAGADVMGDERLTRALEYVRTAQNADGSFDQTIMSNYVTSAVTSALAAIDDRSLRDQMVLATRWLKETQWDQTEGLSPRQDWFGGAGYGNNGRPDLSNTQMMLDALYDAGVSPDDPAMQRALVFLARTQNLKQVNNAPWAGDDGGFVYTAANGGESFASETAGEGRRGENIPAGEPRSLRSYGSMTYAGFKSMLYAGLSKDDPRVKAALDWLRAHWTFEQNPGVGKQGLFYYYHTLARALRASDLDRLSDTDGVEHDWRAELIDALLARQAADGSWVNDADRWMESDPSLVTTYAVLALEEALK